MALVYIEYISRRPEIDIAEFHRVATTSQEGWGDAHAADRLLLNLGRTWRLGPEPEYLGVWYTPTADLERLDAWDHLFRSGTVNHLERPFHGVARIDAAGCYLPLREPIAARHGVYYAEFFRPTAGVPIIAGWYGERADRRPDQPLLLLATRIGRLAPEPGGIAIWRLPNLAALTGIATDLDGLTQPLELVAAGVYHDLGQEIL
ncbi:MAG: hypothetical protein IT340_02475 [Chloroflexi bacterium]|nr:hypothetical protein [Chloroflexota bacterium]